MATCVYNVKISRARLKPSLKISLLNQVKLLEKTFCILKKTSHVFVCMYLVAISRSHALSRTHTNMHQNDLYKTIHVYQSLTGTQWSSAVPACAATRISGNQAPAKQAGRPASQANMPTTQLAIVSKSHLLAFVNFKYVCRHALFI